MSTALWTAVLAVAVLWPARLAGPLDGAPLDAPVEAVVIGVLLPWLIAAHAGVLRRPATRALVVALLAWKAATGAVVTADGWCVRFTSPVPLYLDDVRVPHSWDVRADWWSGVPRCSAVMTTSYPVLERFPVWFYNLPPANHRDPVRPGDRPPATTLQMDLEGFIETAQAGTFQVVADEDVELGGTIDGGAVSHAAIAAGLPLERGRHDVRLRAVLRHTHWSLDPRWNGASVWTGAMATVDRASHADAWVRPWGRFVPALLILALGLIWVGEIAGRARSPIALSYAVLLSVVLALASWLGPEAVTRALPAFIILAAALTVPRRIQNQFGFSLLAGLPFLAIFIALGAHQAGIFTWYSPGDDWWMFQRFSYRIYMQGYWLEGGQATFWFQPFYRWVAGGLHMIFGDSSVGELFWDAGAVLTGAAFAFHVTKIIAGFRWGLVAAGVTLAVFTMGPGWYLFGRGLSEFTSAGFLYGAALFAMRGRSGSWPAIVLAGVLATLAFYTRMNNLPMALAIAVFALPVRQPVSEWTRPATWAPRLSRPVLAGVFGMIALGLWLLTARTYYYTGVPSMLFGTQAGALSVWRDVGGPIAAIQNVIGSLMMVLTMNDPARFDIRAVPILAGFAAAVLAVARVGPFARLPLPVVVLCLAGISGALVARGGSYPGRFSIHIVPVTVSLAVSAAAILLRRGRPTRSRPLVPQPQGTR